jgi:hypothetical protein
MIPVRCLGLDNLGGENKLDVDIIGNVMESSSEGITLNCVERDVL